MSQSNEYPWETTVGLSFIKKQSLSLLKGLGFEINQGHLREYPLRFLLAAQGEQESEANLNVDEEAYKDAIIPYERDISSSKTPRTIANELIQQMERRGSDINTYMIFGSAGTGKSVYLATAFAALINGLKKHQQDSKEVPLHFPVIHSNLKYQETFGNFTSSVVLRGIERSELFPTLEVQSIESLAEILQVGKSSKKTGLFRGVILIDSLDEVFTQIVTNDITLQRFKESMVRITEELHRHNFIPVWSCREGEYNQLNLDRLFDQRNLTLITSQPPKLNTTGKLPYVCDVDGGYALQGDNHALALIGMDGNSSKLSDLDQRFLNWLTHLTRHNPLFFYFKIFAEGGEKQVLMHRMIKLMHQRFTEVYAQEKISEDNLDEIQSKMVISDLLLQTLFSYLGETYADNDVGKVISKFTQAYQHWIDDSNNESKNIEVLNPLIQTFFNQLAPDMRDFAYELMEFYGLIAVVRSEKSNQNPVQVRFRHRAFAEYLGVCTVDALQTDMRRTGMLAKRQFSVWPWRTYDETPANSTTSVRRTGAFASFLPPDRLRISGPYLRLMADHRPDITSKSQKKIDRNEDGQHSPSRSTDKRYFSKEQLEAIKPPLEDRASIVLKGWPGTGKSYTGMQILLSRLVSDHNRSGRATYNAASEANGLVVTLNPNLADYLSEELQFNEDFSSGAWQLDNSDISWSELQQSVDVLSLEEILHELDRPSRGGGVLQTPIIDLKGIHDGIWKRFKETRRKLNNPSATGGKGKKGAKKFDAEAVYSWKEASADLQNLFFDDFGDVKDHLPETAADGHKVDWFNFFKQEIKNSGKITIQSACIKLIHRFIMAFDLYPGEYQEVDTRLSSYDNREPKEIIEDLRNNLFVQRYAVALVDEVQDLPTEACVLIAMLTTQPHDRSRVIFAGDENQVINQSEFKWKEFYERHQRLMGQFVRHYGSGIMKRSSYLLSSNLGSGGPMLKENYRNIPEIVNTWVKVGDWVPSDAHSRGILVDDIPEINECTSEVLPGDPDEGHGVRFVYVNAHTPQEQKKALEFVVDVTGQSSGVSLVSMSDVVDNFERENETLFEQTELFTVNSIKGLERNTVVLIGTMAYGNSHPLRDPKYSADDIEDERMKLIVGMSRGKYNLILFSPNPQDGGTFELGNTERLRGHQEPLSHLSTPSQIEILDLYEVESYFKLQFGSTSDKDAFVGLSELMISEAYDSDQYERKQKSVRSILGKQIREEAKSGNVEPIGLDAVVQDWVPSSSLFMRYLIDVLNYKPTTTNENSHDPLIPSSFEVFFLRRYSNGDDLDSLIRKAVQDRIKLRDGTNIGDFLMEYYQHHLRNKDSGYILRRILKRWDLFQECNKLIIKYNDMQIDFQFDEVRTHIIRIHNKTKRSLQLLLDQMGHDDYQLPSISFSTTNEKHAALMWYLHLDHVDIEDYLKNYNYEKTTTIGTLLANVSAIPAEVFARIKPVLSPNDARQTFGASVKSMVQHLDKVPPVDDDVPNEGAKKLKQQAAKFRRRYKVYFLEHLPSQGYEYLTQATLLSLMEMVLDERNLAPKFRTQLPAMFKEYMDSSRWSAGSPLEKDIASGDEGGRLKPATFRKLYALVPQDSLDSMDFSHLPYLYQHHDISIRFQELKSKRLLSKLDVAFERFVRVFFDRDSMLSPNWVLPTEQHQDEFNEVKMFLSKLLYGGDAEPDQEYWRDVVTGITERLVLFASELYLDNQYDTDSKFVDETVDLIDNLWRAGWIDMEYMASEFIDQVTFLLGGKGSALNRNIIVFSWAGLRFIHDYCAFNLPANVRLQMKKINFDYPFLKLPKSEELPLFLFNEWHEHHLDGMNTDGKYTPPRNATSMFFDDVSDDSRHAQSVFFSQPKQRQATEFHSTSDPRMVILVKNDLNATEARLNERHYRRNLSHPLWIQSRPAMDKFGVKTVFDGGNFGETIHTYLWVLRDVLLQRFEEATNYFELKTFVKDVRTGLITAGLLPGRRSWAIYPFDINKHINSLDMKAERKKIRVELETKFRVGTKDGKSDDSALEAAIEERLRPLRVKKSVEQRQKEQILNDLNTYFGISLPSSNERFVKQDHRDLIARLQTWEE